MLQVSRANSLKVPKKIEIITKTANNQVDRIAVKKAIAIAKEKKFNQEKVKKMIEVEDEEIKVIEKIPSNANELMVITVAKKLCAYVITVTENHRRDLEVYL